MNPFTEIPRQIVLACESVFRREDEERAAIREIARSLPAVPTLADIERVEGRLLEIGGIGELPLVHKFAPGVYLRECLMRAGQFVIGHEHRTEHFNIVLTGRASVIMNGKIEVLTAPCSVVSKPGVRKVLFIHEDMRWATVHPTHETDIQKLEEEMIVKSPTFLRFERQHSEREKFENAAPVMNILATHL